MSILVIGGLILLCTLVVKLNKSAKSNAQNRSRRIPSKPYVKGLPLPAQLGLHPTYPLQGIAKQLDTAFEKEFGDRLKSRFLLKRPLLRPEEFDWQLLELKRYFVLTTLLREVPMFSDDIDEIWHEMLLYSREYEAFCKAFAGEVIHHAPHSEPAPNPNGRAWFDWVYCQLFEVTPYSIYIWKNFFRTPLDQQQLKEFQTTDHAQLLPKYFTTNPNVRETAIRLIDTLREQMNNTTRPAYTKRYTHPSMLVGATSAFVFFSLYEADGFQDEMHQMLYGRKHDPNSSSCGSGFVCATSSDDSTKTSSCSSSSCNSSSCSSSSCGSSCGGSS
ncbi:hypothetical protein [Tumebacillus permanentifrigoris]|uniref:Uncharacterized protein n=1 Tax=Tumebacillus permanentifrigoris TaxID=378543 RepID=A0A316D208_9BACL|nr:hypothetical protein [Tumebacillus permanentifrigoris]PWK00008.1 hypothetical protein C7459_1522 [Tumebacillus permanentifrigoris]